MPALKECLNEIISGENVNAAEAKISEDTLKARVKQIIDIIDKKKK